jgi:hypothetical protein
MAATMETTPMSLGKMPGTEASSVEVMSPSIVAVVKPSDDEVATITRIVGSEIAKIRAG